MVDVVDTKESVALVIKANDLSCRNRVLLNSLYKEIHHLSIAHFSHVLFTIQSDRYLDSFNHVIFSSPRGVEAVCGFPSLMARIIRKKIFFVGDNTKLFFIEFVKNNYKDKCFIHPEKITTFLTGSDVFLHMQQQKKNASSYFYSNCKYLYFSAEKCAFPFEEKCWKYNIFLSRVIVYKTVFEEYEKLLLCINWIKSCKYIDVFFYSLETSKHFLKVIKYLTISGCRLRFFCLSHRIFKNAQVFCYEHKMLAFIYTALIPTEDSLMDLCQGLFYVER